MRRPVIIPWGALLRTTWPKMAIFVLSRASPWPDGSTRTPPRPLACHSKRSSGGLVVLGVGGGDLQAKNTLVVLSTASPPDSTVPQTPPRQTGAHLEQSSRGLDSARHESETPPPPRRVEKIFSKSPKIEEKKCLTDYHRWKELVEKRISIRVPETLWCQAENRQLC